MGIFSFIADTVKAVGAYFGWAGKRQDLQNTPEMQANAAAAERQKIADDAAKTVANQDLDQIRKDASEN